jgi:hypothetical protein
MAQRKPAAKQAGADARAKMTFNAAGTLMLDGVAVTISAYHSTLHAALTDKRRVDESAKAAVYRVVAEHYKASPTYDEYASDQKALKAQCLIEDGSYPYYREQYAGAIMSLFKALPASKSPEALKKAAQRKLKKQKEQQAMIDAGLRKEPKDFARVDYAAEIADDGKSIFIPGSTLADNAVFVAPSNAGAPKGQTQDHPVSVAESVEQMIARVGIFEVIEGLTRVLAVDKSTELPAKALAAIAAQLRRESRAGDVTPKRTRKAA